MTTPFDSQIFFNDDFIDDGTTGNFGGGIATSPTPFPTPTPTPSVDNTCPPPGTFLGCSGTEDIGIFSLGVQPDGGCLTEERKTSVCAPKVLTPTPSIVQQCIQEGGACGGFVIGGCCVGLFCDGGDPENTGVCTKSTPVVTPTVTVTATTDARKIRCCGPATGNTCVDVSGTSCPRGTAECDVAGDSCAPPEEFLCNYTDRSATCESILGNEYTGTATRTVVVTDSTGAPLPLGCTLDSRINTDWNVSECTKITVAKPCTYTEETTTCASLFDGGGYTGTATRFKVSTDANGNFLPLGCAKDPNVSEQWNTAQCTKIDDPVLCTQPEGPFTRTVSRNCTQVDPNKYNSGTAVITQTRSFTLSTDVAICRYTDWVDSDANVSQCSLIETRCTEPTGPFERTVDVACTSISSEFVAGTAKQNQVRNYTQNNNGGTICPYTDWTNSGSPDTTTCQPIDQPTQCTVPSGPFRREISTPCSQVDSKFASGNAIQVQVRSYDAAHAGPEECPYTEWTNQGGLNTAQCVLEATWRSCITGQLTTGNPPAGYVEVPYTGAGGGLCWEPANELSFNPSLRDALRFVYTRGSGTYPQPVTVQVTNSSYGLTYAITLKTNPEILITPSSLTLSPRSTSTFLVNVTPSLLTKLGDGTSTLNMNVEISRIP
jgi:hypothetical protein